MGMFGKKSAENCRNRKVWDEKGQKGILMRNVEQFDSKFQDEKIFGEDKRK